MKCKEIRNLIDRMDPELSLTEKEIHDHIQACSDCKYYHDESIKFTGIMKNLGKQEPVLSDPELLTNQIVLSVSEKENRQKLFSGSFTLNTISRLLTAACIGLLITYGIEQYTVLNKMQNLHNHASNIVLESSRTGIPTTMLQKLAEAKIEKYFAGTQKQLPSLNFKDQLVVARLKSTSSGQYDLQSLQRLILYRSE